MVGTAHRNRGWQFWIDRGGTFTDIVARDPSGQLRTAKLLSENPEQYQDAALAGITQLLGLAPQSPLPAQSIAAIKMGTTVATNALLERQGADLLLVTNQGLGDLLRIGHQARPDIFAREIRKPDPLFAAVLEVAGRVDVEGATLQPLNLAAIRAELLKHLRSGLHSCAIALLHGYRYPAQEHALAELAREVGFSWVSTSHQVSPLPKLVSRGNTTVLDAYLSPVLRRHIAHLSQAVGGAPLLFMQSNGGLVAADHFAGKDAVLSGPAGGIVGAAATAAQAGCDHVVTFDMGGTSTDVALYAGKYERVQETQVAGVPVRVPMMSIHTVAAGGGSQLHYSQGRFRVGPDSAGANPGPASYGRGGPLTVTDCNVVLGRLQPDFFPKVFGPNADQGLNVPAATEAFNALQTRCATDGEHKTVAELAAGFLRVAVENMANAIKEISTRRGHDLAQFALCCFGGAGGQHACMVADTLGMDDILVHPLSGALSAYGMGLADRRLLLDHPVEEPLNSATLQSLASALEDLRAVGQQRLQSQGVSAEAINEELTLHLRYAGSDTQLEIPVETGSPSYSSTKVQAAFEVAHRQRFGFARTGQAVILAAGRLELIGRESPTLTPPPLATADSTVAAAEVMMVVDGQPQKVPLFRRAELPSGWRGLGPTIIQEELGTTVIDKGWQGCVEPDGQLRLARITERPAQREHSSHADPVLLEVFNNLFKSIAEQMGVTLANTAHSVNIKERLDFSCAIFDPHGNLVANAPHVPVHLGSMGMAVQALIRKRPQLNPGEAYASNAPYNGGTHLPDITVITPVFDNLGAEVIFYIASRGHHADVGGITPGSMPSMSTLISEEGIVLDAFPLVQAGEFQEEAFRAALQAGPYPARNIAQNVADIQAQLAANETGERELGRAVDTYGLEMVHTYMNHIQDNAEAAMRAVLGTLRGGAAEQHMDDGSVIRVAIAVDREARTAIVDFTGTSSQRPNNFNAPSAVCHAAVLYVFRTLIEDDIPLNAGCMRPIQIRIPPSSMLDPHPPAAIVAGNVETSQAVAEALYQALGVLAGSQGTMNNLTFGDATHQYYETLCGGAGAGPDFVGADAVHTHMTNSRLTDPEVLESRFPVRLEAFQIRRGSGGAGQFRGGDGVIRTLRFLSPLNVSILSNNRAMGPKGLAGGHPGLPGKNQLVRHDGTQDTLPATTSFTVNAGDALTVATPGGGGYGKPPDTAEG